MTVNKVVANDRKLAKLIDYLVELPKLKKYETVMRTYNEKLKEEVRSKLHDMVQMISLSCLSNA